MVQAIPIHFPLLERRTFRADTERTSTPPYNLCLCSLLLRETSPAKHTLRSSCGGLPWGAAHGRCQKVASDTSPMEATKENGRRRILVVSEGSGDYTVCLAGFLEYALGGSSLALNGFAVFHGPSASCYVSMLSNNCRLCDAFYRGLC